MLKTLSLILSGAIDMVLLPSLKERAENKVYPPHVILPSYLAYFNSERTCCGAELACDSIAVPACCKICARVRFAVSCA